MKILFVCRGNIGRSQIAMAFYNQRHPLQSSDSCGTGVFENEGQVISDIQNDGVEKDIQVMLEVGLDISTYRRKHITKELVDAADKVIVMAEKITWPSFLEDEAKVIVWDIENPKGADLQTVKEIRDRVREAELLLV